MQGLARGTELSSLLSPAFRDGERVAHWALDGVSELPVAKPTNPRADTPSVTFPRTTAAHSRWQGRSLRAHGQDRPSQRMDAD